MIKDAAMDFSEQTLLNQEEYLEFNMSLPIQMLFDDFITFVSKTDFDK